MLLVDDDELLRTHIAWLLLEAGLEVTEASTADQALIITSASRPTLVITDVNLGTGMNGFELRAAVRCQWPDIPILMISGLASNFIGFRSKTSDHFLQKPFSFSILLHAIEDLLKFNTSIIRLDRNWAISGLSDFGRAPSALQRRYDVCNAPVADVMAEHLKGQADQPADSSTLVRPHSLPGRAVSHTNPDDDEPGPFSRVHSADRSGRLRAGSGSVIAP